ncbi:MAG: serine hydrolase, partial [Anaerovoracaceae bacterium]
YSNIAYELLVCIIAEVSGLSFLDYMQKHILEPLGMEASTFLTFERKEETLAMPYVKDRENHIQPVEHYPYTREHAPSSTLTSNLADLEKWGKAHLGRTLLKEETYKAAFNQYAEVPNNGEGMGYSWFIRKQNGFTLFGHE